MIRSALGTGAVIAVLSFLLLSACDPVERVNAREVYLANCAACHGTEAKGDGPLAASLDPPPADLTRIAERNGGQFDYQRVMSVIDGYNAPERDMPQFSDMLAQAEYMYFDSGDGRLTPTPVPLVALTDYLVSLQSE